MRRRRRIGVRKFKSEATKILSEVREDEAEYVVTRRGKPVALITPIGEEDLEDDTTERIGRSIERLRRTAMRVSEVATGSSATAMVSRQRR